MIYFLEDDNSIRELVVYTMNSTGFEAVGFGKPGEFWAAMERETPSLVLLDIMLPEEDGLSILKKLRANPATKRLPVMMLTAKDSEYDKVLGLDSGADDYVPKPFGMMELMARIKALLRRSGSTPRGGQQGLQRGQAVRFPLPPPGEGGWERGLPHVERVRAAVLPAGKTTAWCSPGTKSWPASGATTLTARPAPWTYTCAPCARSWGNAAP